MDLRHVCTPHSFETGDTVTLIQSFNIFEAEKMLEHRCLDDGKGGAVIIRHTIITYKACRLGDFMDGKVKEPKGVPNSERYSKICDNVHDCMKQENELIVNGLQALCKERPFGNSYTLYVKTNEMMT